MLKGFDISSHQRTLDDGTIIRASDGRVLGRMQDVDFIVLRAAYGTAPDTEYGRHYDKSREYDKPTMAYAWGRPESIQPIADQAAVFFTIAHGADFLFLDQEEQGFTDAQASAYINAIRAKGRPCGLYHSSSGFGGVPTDAKWVADWRQSAIIAGHPLAADGTKEFPGWALWQWDGAGADGIDNDFANDTWPMPEARYVPGARLLDAEARLAELKADYEELRNENSKLSRRLDLAHTEIEKWSSYRSVVRERLGLERVQALGITE